MSIRSSVMARCAFALLVASTSLAARADAPQTGSFETQFTERSPLSEMKALGQRLQLRPMPTQDYDLAAQHFLVYVPEAYDATKPMGLLVLVNYKPSDQLPDPILPQLAAVNCALVVAKEMPADWWQRAGLALDAVQNLSARYAIDPKRIYVISAPGTHENGAEGSYVALRLGLYAPEVFTGSVAVGACPYFRQVRSADNRIWKPDLPVPQPREMALTQQHPLVLGPASDDWLPIAHAYAAPNSGFKHVKITTITSERFHYPNLTTDWLPDVLAFLDQNTATLKLPATRPSPPTRPATRPTSRPS